MIRDSIANHIMPLNKNAVRTIDRTGGTMLHTSRTHPGKVSPSRVPDFLKDPDHLKRKRRTKACATLRRM
jgi:6-phosphofructokinase